MQQKVGNALQTAYDILWQCNLLSDEVSVRAFSGDDYLRDLSTGNAHTLLGAAKSKHAMVVFALDTLMQAQFAGEAVSGDDYLRDLSTGSARTLLDAAKAEYATVVFARDTRMQAQFAGEAFGIGNTRMRPWLANSVWMMLDIDDPGIALAHELYHVLANDGTHVEGSANLMQGRTRPDSTTLTPQQCQLAVVNGIANGLLRD